MPVSIQRYNQKGKKHPNDRIIFVKALPGTDHDTAEDFLMRVAAICKPIMENNSLSVMTLEEHEPNREFVGRNFNAGEVVQLVLKAQTTKRWLPFRTVQMVMMHELAHCKQMNHSRAFWAVRNIYACELRELWGRNYTGDGLWGQGRSLYANQYEEEQMPDPSSFVESLCGGTYRSRGRKRKRGGSKPQLSYAERKQRRIEKKFGVNGQALGADEEQRMLFEQGKDKGRSRVAKSKRARDLRAQAALSRFKQQKSEEEIQSERRAAEEDGESTDDDSADDELLEGIEAVDHDGSKMVDSKGRGLVRICEDEDYERDPEARNELSELSQYSSSAKESTSKRLTSDAKTLRLSTGSSASETSSWWLEEKPAAFRGEHEDQTFETKPEDTAPAEFTRAASIASARKYHPSAEETDDAHTKSHDRDHQRISGESTETPTGKDQACSVCSLENPADQLTCIACANVLDTDRLPRYWRCKSDTCAVTGYLNSSDAGRCGLCGTLPPG